MCIWKKAYVCKYCTTEVAGILIIQSPRQGVELRLKSQQHEVWERDDGHCNIELSASTYSALLEKANKWIGNLI